MVVFDDKKRQRKRACDKRIHQEELAEGFHRISHLSATEEETIQKEQDALYARYEDELINEGEAKGRMEVKQKAEWKVK